MEKIGIYAGSFSPFHIGHYDILLKAEKIFKKVIIARGLNKYKTYHNYALPKILGDRTIMNYTGLLTDFLASFKEYEVVLIRGLRNNTDLAYEMTQYKYLQDLMPNINVISIFANREYEHISSSGIKLLMQYDEEKAKKYLV